MGVPIQDLTQPHHAAADFRTQSRTNATPQIPPYIPSISGLCSETLRFPVDVENLHLDLLQIQGFPNLILIKVQKRYLSKIDSVTAKPEESRR